MVGLTLTLIGIGEVVRAKVPAFAASVVAPCKYLASAVFASIVLTLIVQNWDVIVDQASNFAPTENAMNLVAIREEWRGFGAARLTTR